MKSLRTGLAAAALIALLLLAPATSRADFQFDVTVDTSSLVANPGSGPYAIDFTLTSAMFNTNTVTVSMINLGTGAAVGAPTLVGGAAGDLTTSVVLTDPGMLNDFTQGFTPGATLLFHVDATTNGNMPTPDNFSFSLLKTDMGMLVPIPTTDPLMTDTLLNFDLGLNPTINLYQSSNPTDTPFVPTPLIGTRSVPEPGSFALLGLGLLGVGSVLRRRRAA